MRHPLGLPEQPEGALLETEMHVSRWVDSMGTAGMEAPLLAFPASESQEAR